METITGPISIQSIFKDNRKLFQNTYSGKIRENSKVNIEKILQCKTGEVGYTSYKCNECGEIKHIAFTCKSRFCNSCSKPQSDMWMNKIQSWRPSHLLYHHVTFTIPEELRDFFKRNRSALKILPYTAAGSIRYFVQKQQKIDLGILGVIHTFGAKLNRNPHTHLLISHGGFRKDKSFQKKVFLPYKAIATSRTKFLVKYLKQRCKDNLSGSKLVSELRHLNEFYNYHSKITGKQSNWYVDFGGKPRQFKQVIGYLGRYLKRPAISQSRILSYTNKTVTYEYIDKRDQETKTITCSILDFMGHLLQHLPDKNFHMVYSLLNFCKSLQSLIS